MKLKEKVLSVYSLFVSQLFPHCVVFSAVLLSSLLLVLMVLLHQDSDQQHGDHTHLFGPVLLSSTWVQNTQQVWTLYIYVLTLCSLISKTFKTEVQVNSFLHFVDVFPAQNIWPWSPWPLSSVRQPWLSGFLCCCIISVRKRRNWGSSLRSTFL